MEDRMLDARGLSCPEPVVRTRKAMLEAGAGTLRVLVDNAVAVENVVRLAKTEGWSVAAEQTGNGTCLTLTRGTPAAGPETETAPLPQEPSKGKPRIAVFVASNLLGIGDEPLGRILMRAFLKTLKGIDPRPAVAIFINSGVRLTTAGSDLIDDLRELEQLGVRVLSCGTCLDYYGLLGSLEVGSVSNMHEIASALATADRVLRP